MDRNEFLVTAIERSMAVGSSGGGGGAGRSQNYCIHCRMTGVCNHFLSSPQLVGSCACCERPCSLDVRWTMVPSGLAAGPNGRQEPKFVVVASVRYS